MKIGNTNIDLNLNQIKEDLTATQSDGSQLSFFKKAVLLIIHNPMVVIAIIYSLSPIDIVPDAIPFLGSLDDTIILLMPIFKLFQELLNAQTPSVSNDGPTTDTVTQQPHNMTAPLPTDTPLAVPEILAENSSDSMPKLKSKFDDIF